jgi:protein tyrosine phosphatase
MENVGVNYFTIGPKSSSTVDFWRLVWQENVNQIIMLTNIIEDGKVGL